VKSTVSRSRVDWSAQWASSTTTTSGRSWAAASSSARTPSKSAERSTAPTDSPSPVSVRRPGWSRASAGWWPTTSATVSGSSVASRPSSSVKGR
jgi:hypothetical protein